MFDTSAMTPLFVHDLRSSSSMSLYPPLMPFQIPQTNVHHLQFPQTPQDEVDDDESHQQQPTT